MKKLLIAGGTGFIGQAFIKAYSAEYDITVITRDKAKALKQLKSTTVIAWQEEKQLEQAIKSSDVIINLAGESIGNKRWSIKQQAKIIRSRMDPTQRLIELMLKNKVKARLLNASAIGIYGIKSDPSEQMKTIFDESTNLPLLDEDFLSTVGLLWEQPLNYGIDHGLDICKLRFGVVLGKEGGMLAKLYMPYKCMLGGTLGSGKQPISWISLSDLLAIMKLLIACSERIEVVNLVAPEVVSQSQFAKLLAKSLKRMAILPMPGFIIKLIFGQMGQELLLSGQHVKSAVLKSLGYEFKYPTLEKALDHLYP